MKRKPLNVQSLLAIMLISIGAANVSSSDAIAQAPKAESPPAAATEIKSAPLTPVPPAAAPTTEVVENPYGIEALWRQGDFVARGTLIILMIMSVGSWYIGIIKVLEQRRMLKDAKEADDKFWHAHSVKEGVAALNEDSAFRFVAEKSSLAAEHHGTMQTKQLDRHALDDHRDGDEEDDQQYEHHVHERGRVDIRDEIVFGVRVADGHAHDSESARVRPPRPMSDMWTPPPKCRMNSIATRLRRTSQL